MKDNNNVVIDSIDRGILKKDFRFFIYEIYGLYLRRYVLVFKTSTSR